MDHPSAFGATFLLVIIPNYFDLFPCYLYRITIFLKMRYSHRMRDFFCIYGDEDNLLGETNSLRTG